MDADVVVAEGQSAAPEGLRERKKRATREAIHRAAVELVEEHGLADVTTEQIAARAGVSQRTVFNYFATKQDAVLGLHEDDLADAADWLEHRPQEEALIDGVRAAAAMILTPHGADVGLRRRRRTILFGEPDLIGAIVHNNIAVEHALVAALERRTGCAPGADLSLRVLVTSSLATLRSCVGLFQGDYRGPGFEATLDEAFGYLRSGLGGSAGQLGRDRP